MLASRSGFGTTGRFGILLFFFAAVGGCTSMPDASDYMAGTAELEPMNDGSPAYDGRARFREIFCEIARNEQLANTESGCEQYLWRLSDEAPSGAPPATLPRVDKSLHVVVVGGAFSDCFGDASIAYGAASTRLATEGVLITHVPISGRSSAAMNAGIIAETLGAEQFDPGAGLILVGYSKGTVDILQFLVEYPELAQHVAAVVSASGPVFGSAVADRGAWIYDTLLKKTFKSRCDPGDLGVVDSMKTDIRRAWLEQNALPRHVRFYTLSAFTTREHMARGLVSSWRILAGSNRRNDGQVTISDGLIPGSTLLGYANSDHWGIAIDIEQELEFIAGRPSDERFPRGVLFEAYLRYVSEDLADQDD